MICDSRSRRRCFPETDETLQVSRRGSHQGAWPRCSVRARSRRTMTTLTARGPRDVSAALGRASIVARAIERLATPAPRGGSGRSAKTGCCPGHRARSGSPPTRGRPSRRALDVTIRLAADLGSARAARAFNGDELGRVEDAARSVGDGDGGDDEDEMPRHHWPGGGAGSRQCLLQAATRVGPPSRSRCRWRPRRDAGRGSLASPSPRSRRSTRATADRGEDHATGSSTTASSAT